MPDNTNRYGVIRISTLNGRGKGEVIMNCETEQDFTAVWNRLSPAFKPSTVVRWKGQVGAIGDGVINFSYKIFARGTYWACEPPTLESRLFSYKIRKGFFAKGAKNTKSEIKRQLANKV